MIVVELIKMVCRPRTWLIIGMLVALPTLVAVLLAHLRPTSVRAASTGEGADAGSGLDAPKPGRAARPSSAS